MDAMSDVRVRRVVLMTAAQVGKTFMQQALMAYYIANRPRPMLFVMPTAGKARVFMKTKLRPFLEAHPKLLELTGPLTGTATNNTTNYVGFPAGFLRLGGAESRSDLTSDSIAVLMCDELDDWGKDAKGGGSPLAMARSRGTTFWDFKEISVCTPKPLEESTIYPMYLEGSQEEWCASCPSCEALVPYSFERFDCDTLLMACPECGSAHDQLDWQAQRHEFVPRNPDETEIRSFNLNTFAAPWVKWRDIATRWREAHSMGEHGLKAFWQDVLGWPYQGSGEQVEPEGLLGRCEPYAAECPEGVLFLTAGVDVQTNRLEVEVVGWGLGYESWSVAYHVLLGNPHHPDTWSALDPILKKHYQHEKGYKLRVARTFIDSGFLPHTVHSYVAPNKHLGISACKGSPIRSYPIVAAPTQKALDARKVRKSPLFMVGGNEAKNYIFSYLNIQEPGAGYCHFKLGMNDAVYFKQLTAEKRVKEGDHWVWKNRARDKRNEAVDLRVYAFAAAKELDPNWQKLLETSQELAMRYAPKPLEAPKNTGQGPKPPPAPEPLVEKEKQPQPSPRRKGPSLKELRRKKTP
jgi:phage terminase large subunit GpA-like protein